MQPITSFHHPLIYLVAALAFGSGVGRAQSTRSPVLLELFTSEGCSSCPPADQLLRKLDREQPFPSADLIVLSEHVDYWNEGGWFDPYSSASFSDRQRRYASQLRIDDVYTPQLVVDGKRELVGSDWPKVKAAIDDASHARKLSISLESGGEGRTVMARIMGDPQLPAGDVYLALAADADSQVKAGENSGRHLMHTAVVYYLSKVGKISPQNSFEKSLPIPSRSKWGGASRVILFVQNSSTGQILGVAQVKLS